MKKTGEKQKKTMGAVIYHGKKNPLIVITIHKCANNVRMHGGGVVQV